MNEGGSQFAEMEAEIFMWLFQFSIWVHNQVDIVSM